MDALDAFIEIEKYAYLLLGKLAIEEGYIDYKKLLKALEIQHRKPEYKLGSILVKLEYLSVARLKGILQLQNKLRTRSPRKWPDVPDAVLKGMFYLAKQPMGQVKAEDFKRAEALRKEYREKKHKKTLSTIFIEKMRLASRRDLQELRRRIKTENWQCPHCQRIYHLFNYDGANTIPCPICREPQLKLYHEGKKSVRPLAPKIEEKTAPQPIVKEEEKEKKQPLSEKKPTQRADDELMDFYATLEEMQPEEIMTEGNRSETSPKTGRLQTLRRPAPKLGEQRPGKAPQKSESTASSKKALGDTARVKMQELYQEIGKNIDHAPLTQMMSMQVRSQIDALQTPKYGRDVRRWKIYAKVGMVFAVMTVVLLVVFFSSLTSDVKTSEKRQRAFTGGTKYQTAVVVRKNSGGAEKDPLNKEASLFIGRMLRGLCKCKKPSQKIFNSCLKQIREQGDKYSKSPLRGDIYNLTGRLYYYKVYLDRKEKHFENLKSHPLAKKDWKKLWKKKAAESFNKAKNAYKGGQTIFKLTVAKWMPESKHGSSLIRYKNAKEAAEDMERWSSIAE